MNTVELTITIPDDANGCEEVFLPALDVKDERQLAFLEERVAPELLERFGLDSPFNHGLYTWYYVAPQLPSLTGENVGIANLVRYLTVAEAFADRAETPDVIARHFHDVDPEYYETDHDYNKRYWLHNLIRGVARWSSIHAFAEARTSREWVEALDAPGVWLTKRIDERVIDKVKKGFARFGSCREAYRNFFDYVLRHEYDDEFRKRSGAKFVEANRYL